MPALTTESNVSVYRVEEKDYPGELMVEKLQEVGVRPGPIYGQIKAGQVVTLDDGTQLNGKDFIGAPKKGPDSCNLR